LPVNFFCSSCCFLYFAAASGFCFSRISLKLILSGGVSAPFTSRFGTSNGVCICGGCTENVYFPFFRPVNANFPSGPVFDSRIDPCSLLIFTGILAIGFPSKSMRVPVTFPSCCAAVRAAKHPSIPSARIAASAYVFVHFTMPHSPFLSRSAGLGTLAGFDHYLSYCPDSKRRSIISRLRRGLPDGIRSGRGRPLRQMPANAAGSCRRFRRPTPHPDSKTRSVAAERQVPCRAELSRFFSGGSPASQFQFLSRAAFPAESAPETLRNTPAGNPDIPNCPQPLLRCKWNPPRMLPPS